MFAGWVSWHKSSRGGTSCWQSCDRGAVSLYTIILINAKKAIENAKFGQTWRSVRARTTDRAPLLILTSMIKAAMMNKEQFSPDRLRPIFLFRPVTIHTFCLGCFFQTSALARTPSRFISRDLRLRIENRTRSIFQLNGYHHGGALLCSS